MTKKVTDLSFFFSQLFTECSECKLHSNTVYRHCITTRGFTSFRSIVFVLVTSIGMKGTILEGARIIPVAPTVSRSSTRRMIIINRIINGRGSILLRWRFDGGCMRGFVHTVHLYGWGWPRIDTGSAWRDPIVVIGRGSGVVHPRGSVPAHHGYTPIGVSISVGRWGFGSQRSLLAIEVNAKNHETEDDNETQSDADVEAHT